jgi:hypothetical protein
MVRRLALLIVFVPLMAFGTQDIYLGALMGNGSKRSAPPVIRARLAEKLEADLLLCVTDPKWRLKKAEDFFAAVKLKLSNEADGVFLVFPTQYCPGGLFGAHSIPFWVVSAPRDGEVKVLLESTADAVRVLNTQSNGMRDLATLYGNDETAVYKFDGRGYH